MTANPFEMTVGEATQRVEVAYSMLLRVHEIAFNIASATEERRQIFQSLASHGNELRAALKTLDERRHLTAELGRHRSGFQREIPRIYSRRSLARARASLARHTRLHGRHDTAEHLAHDPRHFGQLRGLPHSALRRRAGEAAQGAAAHLESFERIKVALGKLPPRVSEPQLRALRSEHRRLRIRLGDLPSIRGMEQALARTVEAVGGIGRLASHLPAPTLAVVEQAFRAVRTLEKGLGR